MPRQPSRRVPPVFALCLDHLNIDFDLLCMLVLSVAVAAMRMGLDASLVVTALIFGLCVGIHFGFIPVATDSLTAICLRPAEFLTGSLPVNLAFRLFGTHTFHVHDLHLYYNMTSWLWKGRQLERRMGSVTFFVLVVTMAIASSALMPVFAVALARVGGYPDYLHHCAVGLSAVLFALKVVLNHDAPAGSSSSVMGIFSVPSKYIFWVELVIIQLIDPNASWLGHFSGIAAGLLYVRGYLSPPVKAVASFLESIVGPTNQSYQGWQDRAWQDQPQPHVSQQRQPYHSPRQPQQSYRTAHEFVDADAERERVRQARLRSVADPTRWYNR